MKRAIYFIFSLVFVCLASVTSAQKPETQLQEHLQERVKRELNSGIVVGIYDFQGIRYYKEGHFSEEDPRPVDENTIFEIGAVTKIFTASAAAQMVQQKAISWKSATNVFLPKEADPPTWEGRSSTLRDLASHTAALPKEPLHFSSADPQNPYASFSEADLYKALSQTRMPYEPGTNYLYSNFGYGLLGQILCLRANQDYEALIQEKICAPLKLRNTSTQLSPNQTGLLAPGHQGLTPVPGYTYQALAGAGALHSNATDLLRFTGAHLGLTRSKLNKSLQQLRSVRTATDIDNTRIGLGWHITQAGSETLYWQNGLTGGYSAFIGFNSIRTRAVVVLSNTAQSIDQLGFFLLAPEEYPLAPFSKIFPTSPKLLKNYVGTYQLTSNTQIEVSNRGGRLYAQISGKSKYRLYATAPESFAFAQGSGSIKFVAKKKRGIAQHLELKDGLQTLVAKRK